MMIGTKNTPYENGFFFFTVSYPENYPNAPMKVWYYTTHPKMRFNPNLYNHGKICLSIINTWGDKDNWKPEMNTRSVLLSIQSMVLNENPLYNEPGIKFNSRQIDNYNNVLYYCVFNIAILLNLKESRNGYLENNKNNQIISFDCFKNIIETYFIENINWYIERLKELYLNFRNTKVFFSSPYEHTIFKCNYLDIIEQLTIIYKDKTGKVLPSVFMDINNIELEKFTVHKLKNICKKNGIKNYSKKKKIDIINLIIEKNDNIII